MIKRTIEISRQPTYLSAKLGQLVIQAFDAPKEDAKSIPAEDIGVVVVDQRQTTYSHAALQTLMSSGACVVVCGDDHQPAGLLLPFSSHTQQVQRLREQIDASKPTTKRLWQQIVTAKVKHQAQLLTDRKTASRKINVLADQVKSGDTTNIEAQAAKTYWSEWRKEFPDFRRNKDAEDPINAHLNYGYAILRAAVARAIVAAGFQPALGLHHANRANAFCLADDLMEPLRPLIDLYARDLIREQRHELDQANKARLLNALVAPCEMDGQAGPLMVQLHRYTASLGRCYRGEEKKLLIPKPLELDVAGLDSGG